MNNRTSSKVAFNRFWTFEVFATQTTAKLFDVWVYQLMPYQFIICKETHLTFIENIRLHTFMSLYVCLEVAFPTKLLLTNVTHEPSSFIVRFQQMWLKRSVTPETFWTVSTWERLGTSVNINMMFQVRCSLKQFFTVRTVITTSTLMLLSSMCTQATGKAETFHTHRTFVWLVSSVHSHVTGKMLWLSKHLLTQVAFVWFLSSVKSAVYSKIWSHSK